MCKRYLLSFFFLLGLYCHAQTPDWVWARNAPSTNDGEGISIATDNANNLFITGYYQDSITFDSYLLTGARSVFLAKYDLNGNVKWAKTSSGAYSYGYGVATDALGNSYITGSLGGTTSFGCHSLPSAG